MSSETENLRLTYVRKRYDFLTEETEKVRTCLSSIVRVTYIMQILSSVLSLALTALPSVESLIHDFKYILMGIAALNSLIGGTNAVILQLERRKRSKIESNTKALSKIMNVLDDGTITKSELETIIELDAAEQK